MNKPATATINYFDTVRRLYNEEKIREKNERDAEQRRKERRVSQIQSQLGVLWDALLSIREDARSTDYVMVDLPAAGYCWHHQDYPLVRRSHGTVKSFRVCYASPNVYKLVPVDGYDTDFDFIAGASSAGVLLPELLKEIASFLY